MTTYKQVYDAEPCTEAFRWLQNCESRGLTPAQAWDECSRSDWMFWALGKLNIQLNAEQDLRLQVEFLQTPLSDGRVVEDLLTDERSRAFVALKRRRLAGDVVEEKAWEAAWAAARAAARDAAWAAAWAATRDAAGEAAWAAARDAAWAATRDAAGEAAWEAAWAAARAWQADKMRQVISNPFTEE